MQKTERRWTSERLFLLASIGGAVGLGNLWRFPFVAGENGGGAFVIVYLGFVVLIGLPLLLAEFAIGRKGGGSCVSTMESIVASEKISGIWKSIGWMSLAVPFLGFCYYAAVVGWTLHYSFLGITGTFDNITVEQSGKIMRDLQSNPGLLIGYHTILIGLTILVVSRGLKNGIEKVVQWMMPSLFVMLIGLAIYASIAGDFSKAVDFLFTPDFSKLTSQSILIALGQVFFSMAIGVGMMITYSAYLPKNISLSKASAIVGLGDTLVAILAGLAIFPIVFGFGLAVGEGPHLLFVTCLSGLVP
jgi:NSS family neurotransmitter:Na+ symporter